MSIIKKYNSIIPLYCLCLLNLLLMHVYIVNTCETEFGLNWLSWIDNLFGSVFDITVILIISQLFFKRRYKPSLALTFVITTIWSACNIIYSRFFHSYITLSSIEQSNSIIDPVVLDSIIHGLHWLDIYFVLCPFLFFWLYRKDISAKMVKASNTPLLYFMLSLLVLSLSAHAYDCLLNPDFRYFSYYKNRVYSRHIAQHNAICAPIVTTFHRGNLRMLTLEAYDKTKGVTELTATQRATIKTTLQDTKRYMLNKQSNNSVKQNIIFIIVESYMAFTSDMIVNGKEITPNLNKLKHDSTVYYNGHLHPNITIGESADGQYIYMTGLLPLRSSITISKARKRTLPGLPKKFARQGMKSVMIIPTQPTLWNQVEMCQSYGFDKLYSSNDYTDVHDLSLNDQQVFELASREDISSSLNESYFLVILTMSMHQPYTKPIDPSFILQDSSMSEELKNYLNVCHYTDTCIGNYIKHLKSTGQYDNALIIITADHHVHSTTFGTNISNDLPLYIINGNINNETTWHGPCNQIDVYPTLIDLLGLKQEYCGLGHSLLLPTYKNSISSIKWNISEWILQSDYFKNNNLIR